MHAFQRIIDFSVLLFVGVLWGIFLVFGWVSPLGGSNLSSPGIRSIGWVTTEAIGPAGTIGGQVRDESGDPIQGARIQLFRPGSDEPIRCAESDDLGAYLLKDLNAGLFILQAEYPGFKAERKVVMVEVDGNSIMDMVLVSMSSPPVAAAPHEEVGQDQKTLACRILRTNS